ncbi:MAG: barstar family protein [Gudongella sp.]|nr:barstar family protein [Gudongella sp.]
MIVLIDANKMKNKDSFHPYFKDKLSIKGYYGNNLDAMWDAISGFHRKLSIYIYNFEQMEDEKDSYRNKVIETLKELEKEYDNIKCKTIIIGKKKKGKGYGNSKIKVNNGY